MKAMNTNFNFMSRIAPGRARSNTWRWRTGLVAALVLVSLAFVAMPAAAGPQDASTRKLDQHLQAMLQKADKSAQRVIVQAAPGAGPAVADAARKKGRRADQVGSSAGPAVDDGVGR